MTEQKLRAMKIGERRRLWDRLQGSAEPPWVTRVPGGWIFEYPDTNGEYSRGACFVPDFRPDMVLLHGGLADIQKRLAEIRDRVGPCGY